MPTYEYLCNACDHEFEREQRITDPKVRTCPQCKKRRVERLISQTSFVLKGSGWYSDLYSSAKDGKKDASKDTVEKSADSGDAKSGDSKKDSSDSKSKPKKDSKKGSKSKKGPKAAA